MGCLTSKKQDIYKPQEQIKFHWGQYNNKWIKRFQNQIISRLIIYDINGIAQHPSFQYINKDVTRTFPLQQFFKQQSNIQLLRQVLKCYAITFPKLGYTQGLGFLPGFLLLNKMNKSQSLNILCAVSIDQSLMCLGMYQDKFPLTYLYCQLFWKLLNKKDYKFYEELKQICQTDGIDNYMWIFQWYMTFYLNLFPLQYCAHFINSIFQQKQFQIVKISIAIVLCLKQNIAKFYKQNDERILLDYFQQLANLDQCQKVLKLPQVFEKANQITSWQIKQSLMQIKRQKVIDNFYLQYFIAEGDNRKRLYDKFIEDKQNKRQQLINTKFDTKLMESYRRRPQSIEILDQILLQSIKRQRYRKQKSSMIEIRKNKENKNPSVVRWKSLIVEEQQESKQVQGQTTVSIVKKVIITDDKIE